MITLLLLTLLAVMLLAPPILLSRREEKMRWRTRYLLSALPAVYTWTGWKLGVVTYDYFGCQGGAKNVHGCLFNGIDFTPLVGHEFFLMIVFIFVAAPLSLWLMLNTGAKQIGAWHRREWPTDEPRDD